MGHAGCDSHGSCGRVGLLNEEGLLINNRLCSGRHGRLSVGLRL